MSTRDRMNGLLEAVVAVGSDLHLEIMLRRIVEAAVNLTDARYGALGVLGEGNRLAEFVPVGLSEPEIGRIHHWPRGEGILGLLFKDPRLLRLADLSKHPESAGFPDGHPPMRTFLGVPVRVRGEVFGNLYLTEKAGGGEFTADDESAVSALAAAAGVAVENARLYEDAQRRQRWQQASSDLTTRLLSGDEPAAVLAEVTRQARELSGADLAVLAVPEQDKRRLMIACAEGEGADAARGLVLPADRSLAGRVLGSGQRLRVADFAADDRTAEVARTAMGHIGPAVVFPLGAAGDARGVLTIGRRHGALSFPQAAADVAASFAAQAGVVLELAERRRDIERLSVYADRDRIARDLHDQVIQRLYATGMSLQGIIPILARPEAPGRIQDSIDALDDTIHNIRATIFALQTQLAEQPESLHTRVLAVVDEMTPMLGFSPSVQLGAGLDERVPPDVAEQLLTVAREALSNVARHARASQAEVSIAAGGDLTLRVTDDGTGIAAGTRRSGLANMAERATQLGGTLRTSPADQETGTGTVLEWQVPLT
ncbi:MAG: GAF domain-containing protein [Actinobacteria bacterium]|nr:GAF domain-containing protein [Actinomycetota bacterium]